MPIIKLPPIQNQKPGSTAVLPNPPYGYVYEGIALDMAGSGLMTKQMITEMRLTLGGNLIWQISGADLDGVNRYNGYASQPDKLGLYFANYATGADPATRYTGCVDLITNNPSDFQLELDLSKAAQTPNLVAYASVRNVAQPAAIASVVRVLRRSIFSALAAEQYSVSFPKGGTGGALMRAIYLFNQNITELEFLKNNKPLVQKGLIPILQFFENLVDRNTQPGLDVLDFMLSDSVAAAVNTLGAKGIMDAFQLLATFSATDTIRLYSDFLADYNTIT